MFSYHCFFLAAFSIFRCQEFDYDVFNMYFLGFVQELHLEFTELCESLVSTCLCQIWDFSPIFFFFLLCSYWIVPVDLTLSCLFPVSFPIHYWVNPVNYVFQRIFISIRFFILFLCCNFVSRFFTLLGKIFQWVLWSVW